MSDHTHVWHGTDVDVDVYIENEDGEVMTGGPILSYCYWQSASVNANKEQTRRPVTGRARKKITNRQWQYSLKVDHMYFSMKDELRLTDIFHRNQPLQLHLRCVSGDYTDDEQDIHVVRTAHSSNFNVVAKENNVVTANANFEAEDFSTLSLTELEEEMEV